MRTTLGRLRTMKPRAPDKIGDDDGFAILILAARDDEDFRAQLTAILSLEDFHRRSLLNTLLQELRMKQAPEDLIRSIGYLLDDAVARRASATLKEALR